MMADVGWIGNFPKGLSCFNDPDSRRERPECGRERTLALGDNLGIKHHHNLI
jgi:hypothetical protein